MNPVPLTLQLAAVTTVLLLIVGVPIAWWLSQARGNIRPSVEALIAIPLILPPTVLGFYLLIAFAPSSPLGAMAAAIFGKPIPFSFVGLVIGSFFYSLPFVVLPLRSSFARVPQGALDAAATLGASPLDRFRSIALPTCIPAVIAAGILAFAHTIGEFGVALMIGGNIPGETRVLSVAIYDHVEMLDYRRAGFLSAGLVVFSFLVLAATFALVRRCHHTNPDTPK